jgi:carboxypeptidase D
LIRTGEEVAADFHSFLISFLSVFTDLADAHIYITGESYAGFYIPWIAHHIVHGQLDMDKSSPYYIDIQGNRLSDGRITNNHNFINISISI